MPRKQHTQWSHWLWKHVDLGRTCNLDWISCWNCQSTMQMALLLLICCWTPWWFEVNWIQFQIKGTLWQTHNPVIIPKTFLPLNWKAIPSQEKNRRGRCGGLHFWEWFWIAIRRWKTNCCNDFRTRESLSCIFSMDVWFSVNDMSFSPLVRSGNSDNDDSSSLFKFIDRIDLSALLKIFLH